VQISCWWDWHDEVGHWILQRDIWICHSSPIPAMPPSWQWPATQLSSYGGVQNCGRSAILKTLEWAADYSSPESHMPTTSWTWEWYFAGVFQLDSYLWLYWLSWAISKHFITLCCWLARVLSTCAMAMLLCKHTARDVWSWRAIVLLFWGLVADCKS